MMYSITLHPVSIGKREVRRVPFSPNKILHWANKMRWKKAWEEEVWVGIKQAKVPKMQKAKIKAIVYAVRLTDLDNCFASLKPIFDGVVKAGIIKDDKKEYCEMEVEQVKVNRYNDERIVLSIEALKT